MKQVLNLNADIAQKAEGVEVSKLDVREIAPVESKRRVNSWFAPLGLVPVQTNLFHSIKFLGSLHRDVTLFERYRHVRQCQRYDK